MKYIILCIIPILLCTAAGIAIIRFGGRRTEKGPGKTVMMTVVFIVLLIIEAGLWYVEGYYHAGKEAHKYMMSGRDVAVKKVRGAYFFDGPGESSALIFYPDISRMIGLRMIMAEAREVSYTSMFSLNNLIIRIDT